MSTKNEEISSYCAVI